MPTVNPLTLPELLLRIANHLKQDEIAPCLRVCKTWYETLLPIVWRNVETIGVAMGRISRGPSPENLRRHCDLVHTLSILDSQPGRYAVTYPKLQALTLGSRTLRMEDITPEGNPTHMIELNSSLNSLDLRRLNGYLLADFWRAVSELRDLKSLRVRRTILNDKIDSDEFWNSCLNLECLRLTRTWIARSHGTLDTLILPTFPRLRMLELDLVNRIGNEQQLELIRQSPQLEELVWNIIPKDTVLDFFADDITQGLWPKLERLSLGYSNPDAESGRIIDGVRCLTKLDMSCTGFGPLCFQALRRHFDTLTELYLRESSGATSEMLREIMCSCPHLEEFQAGIIIAKDLIEDRPWVCLSMKSLEVCFSVSKQNQDLQAKIFERLSKLYQLERLCVGGWASWRKRTAEEALDLRLGKGLGLLRNLRKMRQVNVHNTTQLLEENDVRWMIANWKNLEELRGPLNQDSAINYNLMNILQQHGIQTNGNQQNSHFQDVVLGA
ncbi:hypothetical protein BGZ80_009309 [Entomortierella chlamydospora]|uniref:F-box domain-containing protein n=1 Tax=Entomortierella chlamydospora TaxID=101097 RepID=A0A9P6MXT6_9FUNG|nr:hypothetical protein BGZ80_009309 [Entomortierella chlamydospora]